MPSHAISHSLEQIIDFVKKMLPNPKIIHHRNQLKHYRTIIHKFNDIHDSVLIDIDFSENLKVPVKFEIQSLDWSHVDEERWCEIISSLSYS